MTPEQVAKAERLRAERGLRRVRFVRGRIEEPVVPEGSVDAVISNGVINLSARKAQALRQAARALRPGGRLAISDVVTERPIIERTVQQADLWAACIAGAMQETDLVLAVGGRPACGSASCGRTPGTGSSPNGRSAPAPGTAPRA